MPTATDTVDEIEQKNGQDDAQLGAQVEQPKTPSDHADARPRASGNAPDAEGDDPVAENDPLILARKGPLKNPATTAKPKAETSPASEDVSDKQPVTDKQPGTDNGEPADDANQQPSDKPEAKTPKPVVIDDDPALNANLSEEAWGKLTHKDKSTFLAVKKTARIKAEEAAKARAEAARHKSDYESIEKFVADQGLDADSYRNSVLIAGMVARGDARALPALEESVARLRKAHGLPDPAAQAAPIAPAVDHDELMAAIEEAETTLDFEKAKQLVGKLKGAAPVKPAATTTQKPQQQPPASASGAPDPTEATVNQSIADYLTENGVPADQVVTHLQRLITANPDLAKAPVRERLRAVMRAHSVARPKAQPTARPQQQPISGRGRTAGGGRSIDPQSQDPLVLARQGKMRR